MSPRPLLSLFQLTMASPITPAQHVRQNHDRSLAAIDAAIEETIKRVVIGAVYR